MNKIPVSETCEDNTLYKTSDNSRKEYSSTSRLAKQFPISPDETAITSNITKMPIIESSEKLEKLKTSDLTAAATSMTTKSVKKQKTKKKTKKAVQSSSDPSIKTKPISESSLEQSNTNHSTKSETKEKKKKTKKASPSSPEDPSLTTTTTTQQPISEKSESSDRSSKKKKKKKKKGLQDGSDHQSFTTATTTTTQPMSERSEKSGVSNVSDHETKKQKKTKKKDLPDGSDHQPLTTIETVTTQPMSEKSDRTTTKKKKKKKDSTKNSDIITKPNSVRSEISNIPMSERLEKSETSNISDHATTKKKKKKKDLTKNSDTMSKPNSERSEISNITESSLKSISENTKKKTSPEKPSSDPSLATTITKSLSEKSQTSNISEPLMQHGSPTMKKNDLIDSSDRSLIKPTGKRQISDGSERSDPSRTTTITKPLSEKSQTSNTSEPLMHYGKPTIKKNDLIDSSDHSLIKPIGKRQISDGSERSGTVAMSDSATSLTSQNSQDSRRVRRIRSRDRAMNKKLQEHQSSIDRKNSVGSNSATNSSHQPRGQENQSNNEQSKLSTVAATRNNHGHGQTLQHIQSPTEEGPRYLSDVSCHSREGHHYLSDVSGHSRGSEISRTRRDKFDSINRKLVEEQRSSPQANIEGSSNGRNSPPPPRQVRHRDQFLSKGIVGEVQPTSSRLDSGYAPRRRRQADSDSSLPVEDSIGSQSPPSVRYRQPASSRSTMQSPPTPRHRQLSPSRSSPSEEHSNQLHGEENHQDIEAQEPQIHDHDYDSEQSGEFYRESIVVPGAMAVVGIDAPSESSEDWTEDEEYPEKEEVNLTKYGNEEEPIVAHLVTGPDPEELTVMLEQYESVMRHPVVLAEPSDPKVEQKTICGLTKSIFFIMLTIFVVVMIGVAITLGLLLSDNDTSPTEPQTELTKIEINPNSTHYDVLAAHISDEVLQNPSSPQFKALYWLQLPENSYNIETKQPGIVLERFAMAVLYYAMTGDNWKSKLKFLSQDSVCDWYSVTPDLTEPVGVTCNEESVMSIILPNWGLAGKLPTELALLSNLKKLELNTNNVTGSLPTELGTLSKLEFLQLKENLIVGTIPTDYGMLTNLTDIRLGRNRLSGTIPTEIGLWTSLGNLGLARNKLEGTIPSYISTMSNLDHLDLDKNLMTGTIPTELAFVTKLDQISLEGNRFTGSLPSELSNLSLLKKLWLEENDFEGSIPIEYASLLSLKFVKLQKNLFTDGIETAFCNNRANSWKDLEADCLGTVPEVECSCCTKCY